MRKIVLFVVFILGFNNLAAQNAYISIDSIYATIPNYIEKLEQIRATAKNYQTEITESRTQNQEKLNQLVGPYNPQKNETFDQIKVRMKETDVLQLELLVDEDKTISKKEESYNKIIQLDYEKAIKPDIEKVNAVIAKYAKSKKLEAVYIIEQLNPALQYVNPEKIATNEIIALLKKEFKN
jgi:Skp family chaperone for outer membrane proteins